MATDKYRPHGHMDSDLFSGWRNTRGDVDQGSHSGTHSLDALAAATEGTDVMPRGPRGEKRPANISERKFPTGTAVVEQWLGVIVSGPGRAIL